MVKITLYCCFDRNWRPGRISSVRMSIASMPPTPKKKNVVMM